MIDRMAWFDLIFQNELITETMDKKTGAIYFRWKTLYIIFFLGRKIV